MRMLATAIAVIGLMSASSSAHALWNYGADVGVPSRHWNAPQQKRHYARGGGGHVSGDCWVAARKGGPCGCMAMRIVGLSDRKFWLVANWFAFPRTSPHVGAAAIWGRHHVEIVTAVHGDGTVSTSGSVGHSRVPIGRLAFVEPRR
jgi:hypothetical protein